MTGVNGTEERRLLLLGAFMAWCFKEVGIKEKTIEGKVAAVAAKHRGASITIPTGDAYI